MALRRGFELNPGERVLVIEDVWTTGGSTREAVGVVEQEGGLAVAAGAIIDRSGGRLELNVTSRALLEMDVPSYEPDDCRNATPEAWPRAWLALLALPAVTFPRPRR